MIILAKILGVATDANHLRLIAACVIKSNLYLVFICTSNLLIHFISTFYDNINSGNFILLRIAALT